jgi:hypothetical protein
MERWHPRCTMQQGRHATRRRRELDGVVAGIARLAGEAKARSVVRRAEAEPLRVILEAVAAAGAAEYQAQYRIERWRRADCPAAESQLAAPGGLQLIEPRATCKANGGVCTALRLCKGSGHHTIAGSCPAGMVCCK